MPFSFVLPLRRSRSVVRRSWILWLLALCTRSRLWSLFLRDPDLLGDENQSRRRPADWRVSMVTEVDEPAFI